MWAAYPQELARQERLAGATTEPAPQRRFVGRDGIWVVDPLDDCRALVGEGYAQEIDELATLYGEDHVNRGDEWLRDAVGKRSSPLAALDPELAAATLAVDDALRTAELRVLEAQEDLLALESRSVESPAAPTLVAAVNHQRDRVDRRRRAAEELAADARTLPHEGRYLHARMENITAVAEWISLRREQAVREAEQLLTDRGAIPDGTAENDLVTGEPPPNARAIGRGDVSAILDARRNELHELREAQAAPGAAEIASRDRLPLRARTVNELRDAIGDARADRLSARVERFKEGLARLPDDWIARRHAELSDPERLVDRAGARETVRTEKFLDHAFNRMIDAAKYAKDLEDELGGGAWQDQQDLRDLCKSARRAAERELAAYDVCEAKVNALHETGRHLDAQLARHGDELVRALGYADEAVVRRDLRIRQRAERSIVDPPLAILDLVGPRPEEPGELRREWDSVVGSEELDRLEREAGAWEDMGRVDTWHREEQEAEIDRIRAERGMPPRAAPPAQEPTIDPPTREC
jgi:hypothetical protein